VRSLRFHPAARAELVAAAKHHEQERPGYGSRFREEARTVVEQAEALSRSATREEGYPDGLEIRAFRFRVFPYSLIVAVEQNALLVLAVAHARREPGYWRDRLP
jgi:toxin ParE1/3/4